MGYVEGRNLIFEHRVAEGQLQRLPELARDLGNAKVDVILTLGGTRSILSAKNEVPSIPAVYGAGGRPRWAGIVSEPGQPWRERYRERYFRAGARRQTVQLLAHAIDKPKRIAVLRHRPDRARANNAEYEASLAIPVREKGARLLVVDFLAADELDSVFEQMVQERVDGLVVDHTPLFPRFKNVFRAGGRHRLPAIADGVPGGVFRGWLPSQL